MESVETPIEIRIVHHTVSWKQTSNGVLVQFDGIGIHFVTAIDHKLNPNKPLKLIVEVPLAQPSQPPVE